MTFSFFSSELLSTKWESILVSHFAGSQSIIHGWHSGHSCWWWEFMQNWFIHMIFFFFFFWRGQLEFHTLGTSATEFSVELALQVLETRVRHFKKSMSKMMKPHCVNSTVASTAKSTFFLWKQCKYRATSWIELTFTVDYSSLTWSLVGLPEKPVYMGK